MMIKSWALYVASKRAGARKRRWWPSHNIFFEMATPHQMIVIASKQIARHESIQNMIAVVWRKRKQVKKLHGRGANKL